MGAKGMGQPPMAGGADADAQARLRVLYGQESLDRLARARVLVLGLGGVGSSCVEALARGGVGSLVLADRDVVEPSNINRQAIAFASTVGRRKVDVMREMVAQINPACDVETHYGFVTKESLPRLLANHLPGCRLAVDYVVDAIDTISQKLALARLCWDEGIPLVSSMGGANKVHPELLEFSDITRTRVCRVARTMRKECARRAITHLEVLYSPEEPLRPRAEAGSSHAGVQRLGTASFMPPVMGQMIAGRVIRAIVGLEPPRWGLMANLDGTHAANAGAHGTRAG